MKELDRRSGREAFERVFTSPHYDRLRSKLIRIFARRGCAIPEDLADETISRVSARIDEIADTYVGDPVRYFYGVARNVHLEYTRRPYTVPLKDDARTSDIASFETEPDEETLTYLDLCMKRLSAQDQKLILEYYQHDKSAKIDTRKRLADGLRIGLNALRIRAYRIRRQLHECLRSFMDQPPEQARECEMKSTSSHERVKRA